VITEHHLEQDGDRVLWRVMIDGSAALDVLTDHDTLARAHMALVSAPRRGLVEERLGTFGPFSVTMSFTELSQVAVAVDGPELGPSFRGNQAIVFYFTHEDLLAALQGDFSAPAV
jgi:hypothetical protein